MIFFVFKQKTAYEMPKLLEFRRVLFRSSPQGRIVSRGEAKGGGRKPGPSAVCALTGLGRRPYREGSESVGAFGGGARSEERSGGIEGGGGALTVQLERKGRVDDVGTSEW